MRRLTVAGFFTAMLSHAAAADSLPPGVYSYKGPPTVQLYTWNGFYVGGHIGAGWNDTFAWDDTGIFLGGAQVGFNVRAGKAVFGLEGQWTGAADTNDDTALLVLPGGLTGSFEAEIDWLATLTGRAGLVWDRSLFYVKGGAAWVQNSYRGTVGLLPLTTVLDGDETRFGWTVGVGYEYAFRNSWSTRLEYMFMDFGSDSVSLTGPGGGVAVLDVDQQIHALTLSVNYRFDWPILRPLGTPY